MKIDPRHMRTFVETVRGDDLSRRLDSAALLSKSEMNLLWTALAFMMDEIHRRGVKDNVIGGTVVNALRLLHEEVEARNS